MKWPDKMSVILRNGLPMCIPHLPPGEVERLREMFKEDVDFNARALDSPETKDHPH
jgi:hypothetical protein